VSGQGRDPVFVLIHSPFVGPTTWSHVARELERHGREALVPSLLGIADAEGPQWHRAAEAVRAAVASTADPVVLVGHSGGGFLLPMIADTLTAEVAALVFVDSFLPPPGGSLRLAPPEFVDQLRPLATDGVLPPWSSWFGEDAMRELVPDLRLRTILEDAMPRLPLSCLDASVPVPDGWDATPCAYLLLTGEPYGQSAAAARRRGWPVAEISGVRHLAIATEPLAVTDALLELEGALAACYTTLLFLARSGSEPVATHRHVEVGEPRSMPDEPKRVLGRCCAGSSRARPPTGSPLRAGLSVRRLEQLDRVAGRVIEQDLLAARSGDDVVAEGEPGGAQPLDLGFDVVDDEVNAVPATGAGLTAVRHRSPSRALRPGKQ
jgi:pimeloyl-ACP methyl ester carboxylesterase